MENLNNIKKVDKRDAWEDLHPRIKKYTLFSNANRT